MRRYFGPARSSAEKDSVFSGKLVNILDGNCKLLALQLSFCGSNRIGRCWKSCCHHKVFKAARRKYEQVVICSGAGIAEFVRNVTRRNKGVARLEYEHLISDSDFKL